MGVWGMILGVPVFAVFYTLVSRKVNGNLEKRGMPTETSQYTNLDQVDARTGEFKEQPHESEGIHLRKWNWKTMFTGHKKHNGEGKQQEK